MQGIGQAAEEDQKTKDTADLHAYKNKTSTKVVPLIHFYIHPSSGDSTLADAILNKQDFIGLYNLEMH